MKKTTALIISTLALIPSLRAQTSDQDGRSIPARLDCTVLSSNSKQGPFTAPITIYIAKSTLTAERPLMNGNGKEHFDGTIDPLGRIEMTGRYEERRAWVYKLKGQLADTKPTILKGSLEVTSGAVGHRTCTITFLLKPADVLAAFSN